MTFNLPVWQLIKNNETHGIYGRPYLWHGEQKTIADSKNHRTFLHIKLHVALLTKLTTGHTSRKRSIIKRPNDSFIMRINAARMFDQFHSSMFQINYLLRAYFYERNCPMQQELWNSISLSKNLTCSSMSVRIQSKSVNMASYCQLIATERRSKPYRWHNLWCWEHRSIIFSHCSLFLSISVHQWQIMSCVWLFSVWFYQFCSAHVSILPLFRLQFSKVGRNKLTQSFKRQFAVTTTITFLTPKMSIDALNREPARCDLEPDCLILWPPNRGTSVKSEPTALELPDLISKQLDYLKSFANWFRWPTMLWTKLTMTLRS